MAYVTPRRRPVTVDNLEHTGRGQAAAGTREHFIPLRKAELVRLLADQEGLSARDRDGLLRFCRLLEATFHFQYHEHLEALKDVYAPLDPDADTRRCHPSADPQQHAAVLFEKFAQLLQKANFQLLSHDEIEEALEAASDWGLSLQVDFDVFERLEVYARGDVVGRRTRRRLLNLYRAEEVDVPIYQRLVVIFHLRPHPRLDRHVDTRTVYLKIFKNIPKMDLDMLLPGTRVKMSTLDRGRILLPTISGVIITVFKIVKGVALLATAGLAGVLGFLGLVGGTIGYGVKSFFGYLRTKDKYQLSLTRSLYYQNLDNNAGVLFRLLDEAEEQEFREAILAYYLLWQQAGAQGWTQSQLDREAEAFLRQAIDVDVDFEVDDALDKLARLGIAERREGGRWCAIPIKEALMRLDQAWDNFFPYHEPSHHEPKTTPSAQSHRRAA